MSAPKSATEAFESDWNTTAAWAQQQGISLATLKPIYQADLLKLQNGSPMGTAERYNEVLAANNPNQVTSSPSDTPSGSIAPSALFHNSVNDVGMIATGLDPVKLIPNLFDTVKNTFDAVLHPSRETGATANATAANWAQNTLLSFIPGVADVGTEVRANTALGNAHTPGEMLKAMFSFSGDKQEIEALLQHPVVSALDVAPLADGATGLLAKTALGESIAERAGMTTEGLAESSPGKVLGKIVTNTSAKRAGLMIPPGGGSELINPTIGDVVNSWMQNSPLGSSQFVQGFVKEWGIGNQLTSNTYLNLLAPASDMFNALSPAEKEVYSELFRRDQLGENIGSLLEDRAVTAPVRQAVLSMLDGPIRYAREVALANGDIAAVRLPSGRMSYVSAKQSDKVLNTRDAAHEATISFVSELSPADKLRQDIEGLDSQLPGLVGAVDQANKAAAAAIPTMEAEADNAMATQDYQAPSPYGKTKTPKKRVLVFGKKSEEAQKMFSEGGLVTQLIDAAKNRNDDALAALLPVVSRKLTVWGHESVNASDNPAFSSVADHVELLKKYSDTRNRLNDMMVEKIKGKYEYNKRETKAAVELDRTSKKELQERHVSERQSLREERKASKERITSNLEAQIASLKESYAAIVDYHLTRGDMETGGQNPLWNTDNPNLRRTPKLADNITKEAADRVYAEKRVLINRANSELLDDIRRTEERNETELLKDKIKYDEATKALTKRQTDETENMAAIHDYNRTLDGDLMEKMRSYLLAIKDFEKAVYDNPSDVYRDKYVQLYIDHLMKNELTAKLVDEHDSKLMKATGKTRSEVEALHADPQKLREIAALEIRDVYDNPLNDNPELVDAVKQLMDEASKSAIDNLNLLIRQGFDPKWLPHAGPLQDIASGIKIVVGKGEPKVDAAFARAFDLTPTRYDVALGASKALAQALKDAAQRDFVEHSVVPRTITGSQLVESLRGKGNILSDWDPKDENLPSKYVREINKLGLVEFDPKSLFGFRRPSWGSEKLFLPIGLKNAIEKVMEEKPRGILDKSNMLFRYSILGLSPRYTAHILFGGTMMLALRSTPYMLKFLPEIAKAIREGRVFREERTPAQVFRTPAEEGNTSIQMLKDGLHTHAKASGKQMATLAIGENIELKQGIKLAAAKPAHILKAMADINFRFTHYVTKMQSSIAYWDYASKAERQTSFIDEVTGETRTMTKERAMYEGMKHVEDVYGDLRSMSPLERSMAKSIMPFYGWTRHILKYVLSFPADHPWRAMVLGLMAYEDSADVPLGLPERIQFLFFLGSPDSSGNVSAVDTRFMDPFRDVANYGTVGGWIQALNPAILAPLAMIDPSMVYGSNELYPNLTYNQFYGIDVAGSQGNAITGLQQFVPQLGALSSAIDAATQARSLATTNPAAFAKGLYNALNVPFAQVQQINVKEMAAQDEAARFDAAKQAATTAWDTGDFSGLQGYSSVPDPVGMGEGEEYNITPAQLKAIYDQALLTFPGQAPSEVVTPPPLPPGF